MRRPDDKDTPAEVIQYLQEKFPHIKTRLGTKEDLKELGLHVSFYPQSRKSKSGKPRKEAKPTIYYRISPANEGLVFAWKDRAKYVSRIHNALEAKTWGELKKNLPPEEYDWIIDARSDYNSYTEEPKLKSSDPFDAYDDVPGFGDGDYPDWLQQEMGSCLPAEILDKYATNELTFINGPYFHIEQEHEEAICRDLKALGFNVIRRDDIDFY